MAKHYLLSPSGSKRWMVCPASLRLPQESSESSYAAEGTAAHSLAEACWFCSLDAIDFIGREIDGFLVTEEMAGAIAIYVDTIRDRARKLGASDDQVHLEVTLVHPTMDFFGGTIDCRIETDTHRCIIDLKYGAGITVEVDNPQLDCYVALADAQVSHWKPTEVVIVQPRVKHEGGPVRSRQVTEKDLADFSLKLGEVVKNLKDFATHEVEAEDVHPGEHCRWCPAKRWCPGLKAAVDLAAASEFDVAAIDAEDTAKWLALEKPVMMFFKAHKVWATQTLANGGSVPGWKLVSGREGNRAWAVEEDDLIDQLAELGICKSQITEQKLISPAQAEKRGVPKDVIAPLVKRAKAGVALAPASDKRPAIDGQSAADVFSDMEFDDDGENR